jgi:hypothetical protein
MSVLEQDLTASEQSMSKAIAQAWLGGIPEGMMIGDLPLPQKPDDLTDAQISDWSQVRAEEFAGGIIPLSCL